MKKSEFKKWQAEPHCEACGVPWIEHKGMTSTCAELMQAKLEVVRLKQLLSGAMAFRLIVYLSVLKDGQAFTVPNLLRELEKIRRRK